MHFSTAFLAIVAANTVSAASLHYARQLAFPSCATPCLPTTQFDNCQTSDNVCLCTNADYVHSTNACFNDSCSGSDLDGAVSLARTICQSVGVTMTPVTGGIVIAGPTSTQTVST
ncbi:hypothetical protein FRB94_008509 [Tulasnella sp. JGI-2019a]|nr:hypothetical protein FRB94_008509 [Tulasnella sp. JGI-2019a]KAG8999385.1 hypothetical protein FRB93_013264 [Tulasnella sp. JGI-2019a]KAG9027171.1 hypothetical protein FRB95_008007 [Tulasnella sp. JGI-2019a]